MGIPGLLKALKPHTEPVNINKFKGKRVGIDAYSWLHKGAYACSYEICENRFKSQLWRSGAKMLPYVRYCMHRIDMLRFNGVTPVVVFDGGRLPCKAFTENERQRLRDANLEQARQKFSQGCVAEANDRYQRAVDITPIVALELIKVLRAEGVQFVVAPYEADAQLALLSQRNPAKGGVAAVISEDSDLLAYGCNVVVFKMDRFGNGEEITIEKVFKALTPSGNQLSFRAFTKDLFTGMCVLAGCDFLPSIPGIGVKRAHALVSKYRDLDRAISRLKLDSKMVVPEGYEAAFKQTVAFFHHARVYDIHEKKLTFLNPLPPSFFEEFESDEFLGPDLPPSRARAIAEGRLDPITMDAFDGVFQQPSSPVSVRRDVIEVAETGHEEDLVSPTMDCIENPVQDNNGDIWMGTEEELFATLAREDIDLGSQNCKIRGEEGLAIGHTESEPSSRAPRHMHDEAFLAHLHLISSKCITTPHTHEKPPNAVEFTVGTKRVFPPTPNNNPFKKSNLHSKEDFPSNSDMPLSDVLNDCHMALGSINRATEGEGSLVEGSVDNLRVFDTVLDSQNSIRFSEVEEPLNASKFPVGTKRVFQPTPNNNPFKKSNLHSKEDFPSKSDMPLSDVLNDGHMALGLINRATKAEGSLEGDVNNLRVFDSKKSIGFGEVEKPLNSAEFSVGAKRIFPPTPNNNIPFKKSNLHSKEDSPSKLDMPLSDVSNGGHMDLGSINKATKAEGSLVEGGVDNSRVFDRVFDSQNSVRFGEVENILSSQTSVTKIGRTQLSSFRNKKQATLKTKASSKVPSISKRKVTGSEIGLHKFFKKKTTHID